MIEKTTEKKSPDKNTKKWGDSEHDTVVHSNQEPHVGLSEYDQKYHQYRIDGG